MNSSGYPSPAGAPAAPTDLQGGSGDDVSPPPARGTFMDLTVEETP